MRLFLRKLVFGIGWFLVFYFGAAALTGAVIGTFAGDGPDDTEAAARASSLFVQDHVLHLFAAAALLAGLGAATGRLPGTRPPRPLVAAAPGMLATPVASVPRPFGIRDGLVALVVVGLAQFSAFFAVGIYAGREVHTAGTPEALTSRVAELLPIGLLLAYAMTAGALLFLFRRYARRSDWSDIRGSFGLAWGTGVANTVALLCGIGLAAAYLFLSPLIANPEMAGPSTSGQMVKAADGRIAFTIAVVLLAPPTEELFFRGLLIRSLSSRLSLPVAALVSGALFWAIHVPEAQSYWPAEGAIAMLAALVTYLRIRHQALGPAISGHAGYNCVIAASTYISGVSVP